MAIATPRQPKLRKKKIRGSTYYYTEAGGSPTDFGTVQEVSYEDARKLFSAHVQSLVEQEPASKGKTLTAGELIVLSPEELEELVRLASRPRPMPTAQAILAFMRRHAATVAALVRWLDEWSEARRFDREWVDHAS